MVEDKSVSKSHLKLEYMMGMFIATDTQSTNGMVVNERIVAVDDGTRRVAYSVLDAPGHTALYTGASPRDSSIFGNEVPSPADSGI